MAPEQPYSVSERAQQKQASRDADAQDLASGSKSVDDLRRENGHFAFADAELDLLGAESLY